MDANQGLNVSFTFELVNKKHCLMDYWTSRTSTFIYLIEFCASTSRDNKGAATIRIVCTNIWSDNDILPQKIQSPVVKAFLVDYLVLQYAPRHIAYQFYWLISFSWLSCGVSIKNWWDKKSIAKVSNSTILKTSTVTALPTYPHSLMIMPA